MIKKKLAIADQYLSEIKFLTKKQGCDLSLINGSIYWVDSNDDESTDSVPYVIVMRLMSSGIICAESLSRMMVLTPVYMLVIGVDPRHHLNNVDIPTKDEIFLLDFYALLSGSNVHNLDEWKGYTQAWSCDG